jgi:hypothetical protein
MADFKVVGKLVIDDKGQLKVLGKKAKQASKEVDRVGTSAQTADRRLKGAAQASSGGTKNFSKMAQGINGGLVPAYATLAASLFAISALFRGLEEAANIKNQTKGMEIFGNATGIAMKGIVSDLRAATGGMLDFRNAAQQAQIATAAGFNADQIKELGRGAKLASVALGRDLTDSFNRLLRGVTKAEPELLDELGIILRIDDATRKYAQANDLVATKLTIAQRRSAVFEEVSRQLANNFGAFEDGADGALNSFSKLQVAFSDIIKGLTAFIGPLEYVAEFLASNTGAAATIFVGFAASIAKSAFPALTNITAALDTYALKSRAAADASILSFRKSAAAMKGSAADMIATEKVRQTKTQAILKKLNAQERFNNIQRLSDQKRSIALLISNEQKRAAASKKISEAELAHLITIHRAMEASHVKMTTRMLAGLKAVGSGISASIVLPATIAQGALAGVGIAATRLAPIFAALGSLINAAFFIFTTGFILKFLYELIFVTKEEKEERQKINGILEATAEKLKEINRIGNSIADRVALGAADSIEGLNNKLKATFNLLTSIGSIDAIIKITGGLGATKSLGGTESADVSSIIGQQIAALQTQGTPEQVKQVLDLINRNYKNIDKMVTQNIGGRSRSVLDENGQQMYDSYNQSARSLENVIKGLKANEVIPEAELNKFVKEFTKDLEGTPGGKAFNLANILNTMFFGDGTEGSTGIGTSGGKLVGIEKAAKQVFDNLAVVGDGYKPTSFDQLSTSLKELQIEFEAGGDAAGNFFEEVNKGLGLKDENKFTNNPDAIEFIRNQVTAVGKIIQETADIARESASLSTEKASFGKRKDSFATLTKEKLQEKQFALDIRKITNDINNEQAFLTLAQREGEEIAQRKKVQLEQQLQILKAQYKEYVRSNTIVGQLQDSFQDGLDDMFLSIINGTASAKDALKQLAIVVIQELQRIAAARLAASIISGMTGLFAPSEAGVEVPTGEYGATGRLPNELPPGLGGRYGGVFGKKGYNMGGIADGPQSGYNVVMHGREAIVPLPDGDKIPVQLTGGTGPVNSTINVVVNNEGDVETSEQESTALGEAIQSAVTREIADQQRPGGLLSPI